MQKALKDRDYYMQMLEFEMEFGRVIEGYRNKCQNTDNLRLYDEIIQQTLRNALYYKKQLSKLRRGDYEEKELVGL